MEEVVDLGRDCSPGRSASTAPVRPTEVTMYKLFLGGRARVALFQSATIAFGFASISALAEPRSDQYVIMVTIDGLANNYLDDPKAEMPVVRKLAAEGARAEEGMIAAFPTVTWPTHTTLVTGTTPARHGVVGNSYFDRNTGKSVPLYLDRVLNKDNVVQVPTLYDVVHAAGLKTAAVCWPATREAKTLDWTVPDMVDADAWANYGTQSWLDELRQAGIPIEKQYAWSLMPEGGVPRDWLYIRMVRHLIQHHSPNLILLHLVEADHVQHVYGPRSAEAYWIASFADHRIRELVEAIEASPMAGKTTFFILSDHGYFSAHHEIRPNVMLRGLGLIEGSGQLEKRTAYCTAEGGACGVYIADQGRREQLAQLLRKELGNISGIQRVFIPQEFAEIGQAAPHENPRGADLWLVAKKGFAFSDDSEGDLLTIETKKISGTHGYLPDQPGMLSLCVVSGPGLKPGTMLGKIRAIDIAPTVARILGVELPTADGKPLEKLLER